MSSPAVSSRNPIGDDLFLIGHDEYSGKRYATEEVFGLGLAAAVLLELGWSRAITVEGGALKRTVETFSGDPVLDAVLGKVASREPLTYQYTAWIDYLREDLYVLIAERLKAHKVIREVRSGLMGRQVRYEAIDPIGAGRPRSRMNGTLRNPPGPAELAADNHFAALACIVAAMEMWEVISGIEPAEATRNAAHITSLFYPGEQLIIKGISESKSALARRVRR